MTDFRQHWLLVLLLSLLGSVGGCEQRPSVLVAVTNVPPQAVTLRIRIADGTLTAMEAPEFDVSLQAQAQSKSFLYSFGLHPPTGLVGTLSVGAAAFDAQGCLLISGSNVVTVDQMQTDVSVQVTLEAAPPGSAQKCGTTTPILQAVLQEDTALGVLQLVGWGFHPQAQVFVNDTPVAQINSASWDRMTVTPPPIMSRYGSIPVTVRVRNPDGSQDSQQLVLRTVIFSDPSQLTYQLPSGYDPLSIKVGDLNKDGKADVVLIGQDNNNQGFIYVYMNLGDGHLAPPTAYTWQSQVSELGLADMDGDGALDLVFSAAQPASGIIIIKNQGGGTFDTSKAIVSPCHGDPDVFAITDVDNDGRPDVIVKIELPVVVQGQTTNIPAVDIMQQQASGMLLPLAPYSPYVPLYKGGTLSLVSSLVAGDLNGDGQSDFALAFSVGTQMGGFVELSGVILPHFIMGNSITAGQALPLGGGQPLITKADANGNYGPTYIGGWTTTGRSWSHGYFIAVTDRRAQVAHSAA